MEKTKKNRKKIVLIGPVYPYKGGISHYTGLLCRALSREHTVEMISYRMQYPKLLFKKEQRDYENDSLRVEGTDYAIHTANPLNWIKEARFINQLKPDLVIFQWWHPYFAPCYFVMTSLIRAKIMYTCHNVFPHERFPLDRFLTKLALRRGDTFLLHSKTEAQDLLSIRRNADYRINLHPTYNAFRFEEMTKTEARQQLSLSEEEKVLLFFGFVRPYKGLHYLLDAVRLLAEDGFTGKLLVVGDFGENKEEYTAQIAENRISSRVEIYDGYIPDREIEKFFAACDLVVLPYESATQSGIAQIAYGFERPVIVTDVGGLPEVVEHGKTGYIVDAKNPAAIKEAVKEFYERPETDRFQKGIREAAYRFSWEKMTETIDELQGW